MRTPTRHTTRLVLVGMVLLTAVTLCAETLPAGHGTWISSEIKWERPSGAPSGLHSGRATVLRFEPDGRFHKIDGLALRNRSGVSLSNGDGLRFSEGHWAIDRDAITVEYRVVQRIPDLLGEPLPGPKQDAVAKVARIGEHLTLRFSDQSFAPCPDRIAEEHLPQRPK